MINAKQKNTNLRIIRNRANKLGLSQSEITEKVGATKPAVSQWMNGNNYPRKKFLNPLLDLLGLYMDPDGSLCEKELSEQVLFKRIPMLGDNELLSCDKNIISFLKGNYLVKNDYVTSEYCCAFKIDNEFSCGRINNRLIEIGDICIVDADDRVLKDGQLYVLNINKTGFLRTLTEDKSFFTVINPEFREKKELHIQLGDAEIFGRVIRLIKETISL